MKKIHLILIIIAIIIAVIIFANSNKKVNNSENQENIITNSEYVSINEEGVIMKDVMSVSDEGIITNTSEALKQTYKFKNFDITNIEITEKIAKANSQEKYTQKAILTINNNLDSKSEETKFRMNVITKAGMLIAQVEGKIPEMGAKENQKLEIDLKNTPIDYLEIDRVEFDMVD